MSEVTWPENLPDPVYGSSGRSIKHQVRTEKEGGYVQSRARYTRKRKVYPLIFHLKGEDELNILLNFFDNNQGGMFKFDFFGDTGDFRFANDEIDWNYDTYGRITADVTLEEV